MAVGYTSPDRILRRFPELTTVLNERLRVERDQRRGAIKRKLQEALIMSPPPTLDSIAISLKMNNSSRLRVCEPSLCDKILARRLQWQKTQQERAGAILAAALEGHELISLKKFCKINGISSEVVASKFPELKSDYRARYQLQIHRKRLEQNLLFQGEVERAVESIFSRGEYPSVGAVVTENPLLRSGGWHQIRQAIQTAAAILARKEGGTSP